MVTGQIWPFWRYEDKHGKKSTAFEIVFNGNNRNWLFVNKPKEQRLCRCQNCGAKIPREVPRVKLEASYYYGAGYYCLSCGFRKLEKRKEYLKWAKSKISKEIRNLDEIQKIVDEVMKEEQYSKRMSLARMLQVISEKAGNRY